MVCKRRFIQNVMKLKNIYIGCQPMNPLDFNESCDLSGVSPTDDWQPLPICPEGSQYHNTGGAMGDWQCPTVLKHKICMEIINQGHIRPEDGGLQGSVHKCFYDLGCQPRFPSQFNEVCEITTWKPLELCPVESIYELNGSLSDWQCSSSLGHQSCMEFIDYGMSLPDHTYGIQLAVHDCYIHGKDFLIFENNY